MAPVITRSGFPIGLNLQYSTQSTVEFGSLVIRSTGFVNYHVLGLASEIGEDIIQAMTFGSYQVIDEGNITTHNYNSTIYQNVTSGEYVTEEGAPTSYGPSPAYWINLEVFTQNIDYSTTTPKYHVYSVAPGRLIPTLSGWYLCWVLHRSDTGYGRSTSEQICYEASSGVLVKHDYSSRTSIDGQNYGGSSSTTLGINNLFFFFPFWMSTGNIVLLSVATVAALIISCCVRNEKRR